MAWYNKKLESSPIITKSITSGSEFEDWLGNLRMVDLLAVIRRLQHEIILYLFE